MPITPNGFIIVTTSQDISVNALVSADGVSAIFSDGTKVPLEQLRAQGYKFTIVNAARVTPRPAPKAEQPKNPLDGLPPFPELLRLIDTFRGSATRPSQSSDLWKMATDLVKSMSDNDEPPTAPTRSAKTDADYAVGQTVLDKFGMSWRKIRTDIWTDGATTKSWGEIKDSIRPQDL